MAESAGRKVGMVAREEGFEVAAEVGHGDHACLASSGPNHPHEQLGSSEDAEARCKICKSKVVHHSLLG
jgi:hypothetical protein